MSESPRRRARELALQALYAFEVAENEPQDILDRVIVDDTLSPRNLEFARTLAILVHRHASWADGQISLLAKNWDLGRIADLDRIILRMALVEIKEMPDTPVKVAINEAIELAKRFSTAESSAFINGILDHYVKDVAAASKRAEE